MSGRNMTDSIRLAGSLVRAPRTSITPAAEPGVAGVIAGATKAEQVRANAAAADWHLSEAERDELREFA